MDLDSRRRLTLGIGRHQRYLAHEEADGSIVLTPAVVVPEHELRLSQRADLLARFESNRQDPSRLVKRVRRKAV